MSAYQAQRVLRSHFGEGIGSCPMSGKRAAELATGKLDEVAHKVFDQTADSLQSMEVMPGSSPISNVQRESLMSNFRHAKTVVKAVLQLKTAFWSQLPWAFCGLNRWDGVKVRSTAQRILAMLDGNMKREHHH